MENLLNEAALLAARKNHRAITMEEIEEATIKVVVGTEKKSRVMSEKEKKLTAYHEAGHAIATYYCKTQDPRAPDFHHPPGHGWRLHHAPATEDRSYKSRDEMREELVVLLGGVWQRPWCWMTSLPAPATTLSGPPKSPGPWSPSTA